MFRDCRDFGQFPRPGGWHDQDEFEMMMMRLAQCAQHVFSKEKWDADDRKFILWVEENDTD